MLKSTFDKVTNDAGLVTPASIGSKVTVANANNEIATYGVLRFVGELEGQDGIFCGVELAEPLGKNDGSYRGIKFFSCQPNHGLFLPIHRVKLAQKRIFNNQIQRPDRLIKSTFPTFNDYTSTSIHEADLDVSMMSTNSSNWLSNDDGDMFDSTVTYNVARPSYLLQEIEEPKPLISMDDYSFEETIHGTENFFNNNDARSDLNTSYVVHDSTVDRQYLPIIGTPPIIDDLETPVVENKSLIDDQNNHTIDNQNNYDIINQNSAENILDVVKNKEKSDTTVKTPTAKKVIIKNKTKITETTKNNNIETPITEKKEKKRLSVKEMIQRQPETTHKEPRPKKISKQQQLMEQIRQNMKEAKKEPKTPRKKLSDLWTQPQQPLPKSSNEMTQNANKDDKKKTPLKPLNHPPAKPRTPAKPRQSLLPPKTISTDISKNHPEVKFRTNATTKNTPGFKYMSDTKATDKKIEGNKDKRASTTTPARPLSQFSTASSKSSVSTRPVPKQPIRRVKPCTAFEKKLIQKYKNLKRLTTVLGLVSGNLMGQYDALVFKRNLDEDSLIAKNQEIEHLKSTIKNLEESYKEQIKTLREQHQDELNKLKITKENEIQQKVKDIQHNHQQEVDELNVNFIHVENQLKEANNKISELRKTLNETTDSKIEILNLEIKSLQDMLDIKNQEATELLKSKNREIVLREKFEQLEKDYKALQSEYEHESYKFNMNREIIRKLTEECNKKDIKSEELLLKINKLEKRITLYQQRVDELEAINNAAGGEMSIFAEADTDDTQYESDSEKPSSSETDNEISHHHSVLSTYQETGRKLLALNNSVHQDVICLPEGRFNEESENDDEKEDDDDDEVEDEHKNEDAFKVILADQDTF